jgi:sugar transferase (PEP-CTERM/EpsH1 system associated)
MKILFIQNRILFPTNTGGRIRTLNVLRYLAKWHDVTYLCNLEAGEESHCDAMREVGLKLETVPWKSPALGDFKFYISLALNFFSYEPFNVAKDNNPLLRARAEELVAQENYDLVVCDFIMMVPIAKNLACRGSLLFQHNVEAQIFERYAETASNWARRIVMSLQWKKMVRFEKESGKYFNAVIAVSDQDREQFERDYGWTHVHVIDTAVDVNFFQPREAELPNQVAFVGSMDWLPNQEGVEWFVKQVWPLVRQEHPNAEFKIVGRNPSRQVEALADETGVDVLGTVPDVRPYLDQAALVVTPLLVGGGTRIKIFEAMAMKKAVVSTSIGAEGLKVEDQKHILLADSVAEFANAVNQLLTSQEMRQQIGHAARTLVCEQFAAEPVARQFDAVCHEAVK